MHTRNEKRERHREASASSSFCSSFCLHLLLLLLRTPLPFPSFLPPPPPLPSPPPAPLPPPAGRPSWVRSGQAWLCAGRAGGGGGGGGRAEQSRADCRAGPGRGGHVPAGGLGMYPLGEAQLMGRVPGTCLPLQVARTVAPPSVLPKEGPYGGGTQAKGGS